MNASDLPARAKARRARPEEGMSATPSSEGRVIIENVSPEIDGGRAPAKCIEGAAFSVHADIFTDGHEVIAADLLWQEAGQMTWRHVPMHFVDNDRWSAQFIPPKVGRYLYSIEAWREPFASWRRDVQKKVSAKQDVTLEIEEGFALVEEAEGEGRDGFALDEMRQRMVSQWSK